MGGDYYCRASGDAVFTVPKPNMKLGVGIDALPEAIRNSTVLTGNDLGMLANVSELPAGADHASLSQDIHLKARNLLAQQMVEEAWMALLEK
jgi:hypothetical protein